MKKRKIKKVKRAELKKVKGGGGRPAINVRLSVARAGG